MSDNPFANPEADRYFSDQSVRAATGQPAPALQQPPRVSAPPTDATAVLDDYNPFAATSQQQRPVQPPQPAAPTFVQQAPIVVPSNPPAAPQQQARGVAGQQASNIDTQELQRRQEELERKAAELMRKEQELKNMQMGVKTNNFPPLPACCKVKPCFYQDISVEIPVEFQRLLRLVFFYWIFLGGLLLWDMALALALLCLSNQNGGASFGICLVNFLICVPLSYVCWFRPVYKAFRDDSSFNFFVFFIVFAVQFVIHCLHAIGIPGYVPGFINGFSSINHVNAAGINETAVGVVSVLSGVVHAVMAAGDAFILLRVHAIYRASGASLQRAQAEFASGVMSNKGVQQAAAQAATAAAQGAFTAAASQPGNRF